MFCFSLTCFIFSFFIVETTCISCSHVFQEAVEMFSSEKKPTLSSALIFRIEIESVLTPNENDHCIIQELKEKMLSRVDYRFPITDEILIGTLLDPRLQNLPRLQSELEKRNLTKFQFLKNEIMKILPTTEKSNPDDQHEPSSTVSTEPRSTNVCAEVTTQVQV